MSFVSVPFESHSLIVLCQRLAQNCCVLLYNNPKNKFCLAQGEAKTTKERIIFNKNGGNNKEKKGEEEEIAQHLLLNCVTR